MLNAIAMELNAGRRLDFGFARGMGSFGYAVCSWAVGLTAARGVGVMPWCTLCFWPPWG
ncbi:MAG: hypothetical protein ACLRWF_02725 [Ruthenibacterium sp.]